LQVAARVVVTRAVAVAREEFVIKQVAHWLRELDTQSQLEAVEQRMEQLLVTQDNLQHLTQ
jgi:hypothetical protein